MIVHQLIQTKLYWELIEKLKKKLHFTWTPKNGMAEEPSFNGQELGSGGIWKQ
jgi:hypothetical protein